MDAKVLVVIANVLAAVFGALAAQNAFPAWTGLLGAIAGLLAGAANVNKPGTAAKIQAALEQEPPK